MADKILILNYPKRDSGTMDTTESRYYRCHAHSMRHGQGKRTQVIWKSAKGRKVSSYKYLVGVPDQQRLT